MLGRARAATADALEEAKQSGNARAMLLYQLQLAKWDRLIERLRDEYPRASRPYGAASAASSSRGKAPRP